MTLKFDKLTEREKDEICALYRIKGGMETVARMFSDKRELRGGDRIQGSIVKRVLEERHEQIRATTKDQRPHEPNL